MWVNPLTRMPHGERGGGPRRRRRRRGRGRSSNKKR